MESEYNKLAAARYRKGWSQEKVAEAVGVARSSLSQWERGVQTPQEFYVYRLCDFYQMTRAELGLEELVRCRPHKVTNVREAGKPSAFPNLSEKREEGRQQRNDTSEMKPAPHPSNAASLSAPPAPPVHDDQQVVYSWQPSPTSSIDNIIAAEVGQRKEFSSLFPLSDDEIKAYRRESRIGEITRRKLLQLLAASSSATLLLPLYEALAPSLWERLSRTIETRARVDSTAIEHCETLTQTYWKLHRQATTHPGQLLVGVQGLFQMITTMLKGSLLPSDRCRLCSTAANAAQLLGSLLFDLTEYDTAQLCYQIALEAAKEANNDVLWAVTLGRMQFIPIYKGFPDSALSALAEAQRVAATSHSSTTGTVRSWLASIEAQAQAEACHASESFQALDKATHLVELESQGIDPYWTSFSASRLGGYYGACYVRVYRPREAHPVLEQALAELDPTRLRSRAIILLDLALMYCQQQEIEAACTYANLALAGLVQAKSVSVLHLLAKFQRHLQRWSEVEVVKQFNRHMTTLVIDDVDEGTI